MIRLHARIWILGLLALTLLPGCSGLTIEVYQYKGDLAHSYRVRLAEARGKANQAYARMQADPVLRAYTASLAGQAAGGAVPAPRSPASYIKTINSIVDDRKLASRQDDPNQPSVTGGLPGREDRKILDLLEKEIIEFGTFLEKLSYDAVAPSVSAPSGPDAAVSMEVAERLKKTIAELQLLAKEMVRHMEFPDFGDVISEEDMWCLINPIYTYSRLGKSEYVVYKDETGNYQLKSALFDPSDVAKAARKSVTKVLTTVAAAYGIPLDSMLGGEAPPDQPATTATIRLEAQRLGNRIDLMRDRIRLLEERLTRLRQELPAALAGTPTDAAKAAAVDRILRELTAYDAGIVAIREEEAASGRVPPAEGGGGEG